MSNSNRPGSEPRCTWWRRSLVLVAFLTPLSGIKAQEHEEDHDHDHLHFSHPLVTESPSPDTKLRLDYIYALTSGIAGVREDAIRIEGEYAFTHALSLALVAPFVSRSEATTQRVNGVGNIELSLKAATLTLAEHGVLLGGGLSLGLPTGSDAKGIGSSHIFELAPFFDVGYKQDALELVGFATFSSTFHHRSGDDDERNLTFDLSALYQIRTRFEALIELTTARALLGPGSGSQQTFVAPGFKVYPFTSKKLMFGASLAIGTGIVRDSHVLLLSGFYHF